MRPSIMPWRCAPPSRRAQAVAVLEQASLRNPHDLALLGAYGRALAEGPAISTRPSTCSAAPITPDNPDWRVLNAQGAVLDQLGRSAEAQSHYAAALKIVPNEPSVLSNLGLSYALMKDLKRAEITLRRAVAQPNAAPKVRQNLALVVGLQGRFAEGRDHRACRPARRRSGGRTSAICGRCWRSRTTGRKWPAAARARA